MPDTGQQQIEGIACAAPQRHTARLGLRGQRIGALIAAALTEQYLKRRLGGLQRGRNRVEAADDTLRLGHGPQAPR